MKYGRLGYVRLGWRDVVQNSINTTAGSGMARPMQKGTKLYSMVVEGTPGRIEMRTKF
jgi:hypothetical protein